jgi:hypothetical protein
MPFLCILLHSSVEPFSDVTGAMLLMCFLGRRDWGDAPWAPLHLRNWRQCSSRLYLSGPVAMLFSTSLFGSGGNAPLDSFWDWWRCSSLYSLGLAAMLFPPLIGNGAMLLSQIIGTAAMLLLKNPPSTLVCYCLLLTMSTSAAGTPVSGGQGSDSKNANDTKEILRYLDALTDEDRGTLLETLRGYPDDVKGRAGDTSTKPMSFDDYMQMADTCNEEVR